MRIVLAKPTIVRRCIRCGLPISFSFDEIPILESRANPTPLATFFAHTSPAACAEEQTRRAPAADPRDIGVQRARLLDELLADLKAAHSQHTAAAHPPTLEAPKARRRRKNTHANV